MTAHERPGGGGSGGRRGLPQPDPTRRGLGRPLSQLPEGKGLLGADLHAQEIAEIASAMAQARRIAVRGAPPPWTGREATRVAAAWALRDREVAALLAPSWDAAVALGAGASAELAGALVGNDAGARRYAARELWVGHDVLSRFDPDDRPAARALGVAWGSAIRGRDRPVVVWVEEHELSAAAALLARADVHRLHVVVVAEVPGSGPDRGAAPVVSLGARAAGPGTQVHEIDGTDAATVVAATRAAVARCQEASIPQLLLCVVPTLTDLDRGLDPIDKARRALGNPRSHTHLSSVPSSTVAEPPPAPGPSSAARPQPSGRRDPMAAHLPMSAALQLAQERLLHGHAGVVVLDSVDPADRSLISDRLPPAERAALAEGLTIAGLQPILRHDPNEAIEVVTRLIRSTAARVLVRPGGGVHLPIVVRVAPATQDHLQEERLVRLQPDATVVAWPSSGSDAWAVLDAVRQLDCPLLLLETTDDEASPVPGGRSPRLALGQAQTLAEGEDITLVGFGPSTQVCLAAREILERSHGITANVLDLCTLIPFDRDAVRHAALRTRRCLVVDVEHPLVDIGPSLVEAAVSGVDSHPVRARRITIAPRSAGARDRAVFKVVSAATALTDLDRARPADTKERRSADDASAAGPETPARPQ